MKTGIGIVGASYGSSTYAVNLRLLQGKVSYLSRHSYTEITHLYIDSFANIFVIKNGLRCALSYFKPEAVYHIILVLWRQKEQIHL